MATLQSGKCFTVPIFFGMCCRSEWQERMYIYKWHEVDQTKHEIFCIHIVCNEIQVKVNLEITTFFFYLRFPYCPNFFWFGVVDAWQTLLLLWCDYTQYTELFPHHCNTLLFFFFCFFFNNFLFLFFHKQHNIISKIKQNKTADTYSTSQGSIKREGKREGQQEHKSYSFK